MHEIFGDRFLSRGKSAWHGLGRVFERDENVSLVEAVEETAGDIVVETAPLRFDIPGDGDAPARTITCNLFAVYRRPTHDDAEPAVFGTVSDRYHVAQYGDYARALNPLSAEYPVETCGVLRGGDRLFFALRGEDSGVRSPDGGAEDEVRNYFVGCIYQRPGNAHHVIHTPVRVVCANTMSTALANNTVRIDVGHTAEAVEEMAAAATIIAAMKKGQAETQAALEALARTQISDEAFERMLAAAYPEPRRPRMLRLFENLSPEQLEVMKGGTQMAEAFARYEEAFVKYEAKLDKVRAVREAARERYAVFNEEHPAFARTAWAGYAAVTETSDWRKGDGGQSALFGARAREKRRAFAAALDIAGINPN